MVSGQCSVREALKALRKAAKAAGYTVAQPTKARGRTIGKGSHQAWALYDSQGHEVARSLFPTHSGTMSPSVTRSIEQAFEEFLGKGWLDT
jgi:hypothetical protein